MTVVKKKPKYSRPCMVCGKPIGLWGMGAYEYVAGGEGVLPHEIYCKDHLPAAVVPPVEPPKPIEKVSGMCRTYKAMLDRKDTLQGLEATVYRIKNGHGAYLLEEGEADRLITYADRLKEKKFGVALLDKARDKKKAGKV